MILHEYPGQPPIFERENWKEWFRFAVDVRLKGKPLPYFYYPTHEMVAAHARWYWIAPLAPFVWAYMKLLRQWFNLAKYCHRKGLLKNIKPNEAVSILWPRKLLR